MSIPRGPCSSKAQDIHALLFWPFWSGGPRSEKPGVILCTIVWQPTDAWPPSFQQCAGVAASAPQSVWRRGALHSLLVCGRFPLRAHLADLPSACGGVSFAEISFAVLCQSTTYSPLKNESWVCVACFVSLESRRSCTVFVMTPMSTPAREGETIEGSRTVQVPCGIDPISSAQVLKIGERGTTARWHKVRESWREPREMRVHGRGRETLHERDKRGESDARGQ